MTIQQYPLATGGSGSALPYGASALIFSKYSSTGEYTYSDAFSAGIYTALIYTEDNSRARIEGSSFNAYTSASGLPVYFEIKDTESNIYIGQAATLATSGWDIKSIEGFPIDYTELSRNNSNGYIYAGTNNGKVVLSTNGTTFNSYDNRSSIYSGPSVVAWSTAISRYIMVGAIGQVSLSADGVTWTTRFNLQLGQINDSNDSGVTGRPYSIRWVNNRFMVFLRQTNTYWSTSGLTWTALNTFQNAGYEASDVAYGDNKYVVTGDNQNNGNNFFWSTNGTTWTTAAAQIDSYNEQPRTIVWSGTRFVAPCYDGYKINWSTNGTTWSTAVAPRRYTWSVAHGNGVYVANTGEVGTGIIWSTNGTTWVTRTTGLDSNSMLEYYPQAISFLNGYFIHGNQSSAYRYSTDGITWVTGNSGSSAGIFAFNGNSYVSTYNTTGAGFYPDITRGMAAKITPQKNARVFALKTGFAFGPASAVVHTLDGSNLMWSTAGLTPLTSYTVRPIYTRWNDVDVFSANGGQNFRGYVAVGTQGKVTYADSSSPTVWVSNGVSAGSATLNAVFYESGSGRTYAGNVNGNIYWSTFPGANSWTDLGSRGFGINALGANFDGSFYAAGTNGALQTTTDFSTWVTRTSQFGTTTINKIATSGASYMAVGDAGTIRSSTDGITWTTVISPTTNRLNSVAYSGVGRGYYVVGDNNTFLYTPNDGATWRQVGVSESQTETVMTKVRYLNNKYFILSNYGAITTSTDAITWVVSTQNLDGLELQDMAYGNSTYVICGNWARIWTSSDGETWTKRTTVWSTTETINAITYGASKFIATGNAGKISTSTDGITWTTALTPIDASASVVAVAYYNDLFIIGNTGGTIATSTDGITWTIRDSKVNNQILRFAFNNYNIVALDAANNVSYSIDGITWSLFNTSAILASNNNIIYGAGMFITHTTSPTGSFNTSLKGNFSDNLVYTQNHNIALNDVVYSETTRTLYGIARTGVIAQQTIPVRNVPTSMFLYNTTVDKVN